MTDEDLLRLLSDYLKIGNYSPIQEHDLLLQYKNAGGTKEEAQKLVENLAEQMEEDQTLYDRAYDILDIITGWCNPKMRVWD